MSIEEISKQAWKELRDSIERGEIVDFETNVTMEEVSDEINKAMGDKKFEFKVEGSETFEHSDICNCTTCEPDK